MSDPGVGPSDIGDAAGQALDKIFTGVLGLAGTVVGFFFGAASTQDGSTRGQIQGGRGSGRVPGGNGSCGRHDDVVAARKRRLPDA